MSYTRDNIVGHLPMEISRITKFLLHRGARIKATLRSIHYRRPPFVQGGLEIPCTVKVSIMPTQSSKKLVDRYRELVESFYFEPPDSEIIGSFLQSDEEKAPGSASATSSGKNVCSKNSNKRKDGDCNVCTIFCTTGIKDIRSYFKHTSIVKSTPINRSDKDTIVID